jgi:hypothetical protein
MGSLNHEPIPLQNTGLSFPVNELMWQLFNSEVPAGWLAANMYPFNG